jgi:hypothetical protein
MKAEKKRATEAQNVPPSNQKPSIWRIIRESMISGFFKSIMSEVIDWGMQSLDD